MEAGTLIQYCLLSDSLASKLPSAVNHPTGRQVVRHMSDHDNKKILCDAPHDRGWEHNVSAHARSSGQQPIGELSAACVGLRSAINK
ncbi:hypothetical protein KEM48_010242 [Puccinia striiformis f. sp. tritici PST-130]|nr:hypothetical protein KEM48_010242 [Puccinia striiformis f. sp. tritici PST-130]